MTPFERIEPPANQKRLRINRYASWHTWSPEFRAVLKHWGKEVRALPAPTLIHLAGGQPYDYTLSLRLTSFERSPVMRNLFPFARGLFECPAPTGIMLFSGLLVDGLLDRVGLRYLFAFFRDVLARLAGNEMYAFYAPLGATGRFAAEFPLHADLYIPQLLLNVFDDVAADSSGQSLFLSARKLRSLLGKIPSIPLPVRTRIRSCLTGNLDGDRYEEFFELLHGTEPWTAALELAMDAAAMKIKLRSGQGYLIHDRTWLHGRDAPVGGVRPRRVHRLIFNSRPLIARLQGRSATSPRAARGTGAGAVRARRTYPKERSNVGSSGTRN